MSAIIPAGYEVRDEAGNLVAVVVRDIHRNTLFRSSDFVNYAGVPFEPNMTTMPRAIVALLARIQRGEPITSP